MNDYLEIDYAGADAPNGVSGLTINRFNGNFNTVDVIGRSGTADPSVYDKDDFCFEETSTGDLFFIAVIKRR